MAGALRATDAPANRRASADDGVPVTTLMRRFLTDCSGSTAIEYGLIAAAIACVIIGSVQKLGTNLKGNFTSLQNAIK